MGLSFGSVVGAPVGDSLVGAPEGEPAGDTVVRSVVTCVGGFPGVGRHLGPRRCDRHGRSQPIITISITHSILAILPLSCPYLHHSVLGRIIDHGTL